MKSTGTRWGIAVVLVLALAGVAIAQGKQTGFDFGKREFEAKCASCHGASGRGDGVNKPFLATSPANLSTLAKANGGEFPYMHFYAVVDGRFERGATDMPCFADAYLEAAAKDYMDAPYTADQYLETRLVALASYVAELQVK